MIVVFVNDFDFYCELNQFSLSNFMLEYNTHILYFVYFDAVVGKSYYYNYYSISSYKQNVHNL